MLVKEFLPKRTFSLATLVNLFFFTITLEYLIFQIRLNPLSANPTKWSNTLKQFLGEQPANCLCVFDHFVGLALKG